MLWVEKQDSVQDSVKWNYIFLQLPVMRRAASLMPDAASLLYLAAPWSPPAWMKTNNRHNGSGSVKKEYWQAYANYLVRWGEVLVS